MSMMTAPERVDAARLFHALSDETRLALLEMLRGGERCVCELQDVLHAAQSRLSFHLRVLKEAGLVNDRRDGRWSYYAIDPDALDRIGEVADALRPGVVRVGRAPRGGSPDGRKTCAGG